MPIGNLTSQIFANIYLHELDHYMSHTVKPRAYVRYGDDSIMFTDDIRELDAKRHQTILFLRERLGLAIKQESEILTKVRHGVHMLGVHLYSKGRRLDNRARSRAISRLAPANFGSYFGLVQAHENEKYIKRHSWRSMKFV
jgi:hypothetical protein